MGDNMYDERGLLKPEYAWTESPEFCSCLYYQYALKPFSIRPFLCQYFYIFMLCNLM